MAHLHQQLQEAQQKFEVQQQQSQEAIAAASEAAAKA